MDIIRNPRYEELQEIYQRYFSFGNFGISFDAKLAFLSMLAYITEQLKAKKPDITHYQVLRNIVGSKLSEDVIKGIAVVCADMSYNCKEFPTFGLNTKQMINKIKDLADNYLPF